jgi:hypothetical protein
MTLSSAKPPFRRCYKYTKQYLKSPPPYTESPSSLVKVDFLPMPPKNIKTFNPDFFPVYSKGSQMLLGVASLILTRGESMARDVVPAESGILHGKWDLASWKQNNVHTRYATQKPLKLT